jgi:Xaa-Pro aminopeptidase
VTDLSRRTILGAGAAAGLAPFAAEAAGRRDPAQADIALPDLSFLRDTPLADRDRLSFFMREAGVDALVLAHPANVFYATNHWPQLDRMGLDGSGIAVVCADRTVEPALVMHAFLYYYTHTPESDFRGRQVFTYTEPSAPAGGNAEPKAAPARTMRVVDGARVTPLDRHRVDLFARTSGPSADASWALIKAVRTLGLAGKRLGTDDPALAEALTRRGFDGSTVPGENIVRRARLAKSPAELRLIRFAASANVAAAIAAAGRARELGTARRLRADFYAEAARRGNLGHFMVIAGSSSEAFDQELRDGSSVSIDCVSTCRFYHGDFARSIFVGEPPPAIRRAVDAVQVAWQEIREQLRPGMRFADVSRIGRDCLKKQGADLTVGFTPHSVGLFHTDHPQPSLIAPRAVQALELEENMVLSVDCPVFMAGLGGTLHYEDLMLIRQGGAVALHDVPPPVILV